MDNLEEQIKQSYNYFKLIQEGTDIKELLLICFNSPESVKIIERLFADE